MSKTICRTVYEYDELSEKAKENVRYWFIETKDERWFEEDIEESFIKYFFPKSDLNLQYQLIHAQGDGANLYGQLCFEDVINYIKNWNKEEHNTKRFFFNPVGTFTEKEMKRLLFYIGKYNYSVTINHNRSYGYSLYNKIFFAEDMIETLKNDYIRNVDEQLIYKFEETIQDLMWSICGEIEEYGYRFFDDCTEDEIKDFIEANDYMFEEDGTAVYMG